MSVNAHKRVYFWSEVSQVQSRLCVGACFCDHRTSVLAGHFPINVDLMSRRLAQDRIRKGKVSNAVRLLPE